MGFNPFFPPNGVTIDASGRVIHRGDLGIRETVTLPLEDPFKPKSGAGAMSELHTIGFPFNADQNARRRESVLGLV